MTFSSESSSANRFLALDTDLPTLSLSFSLVRFANTSLAPSISRVSSPLRPTALTAAFPMSFTRFSGKSSFETTSAVLDASPASGFSQVFQQNEHGLGF